MILFFKLLIAHFIGDFFLQTNDSVKSKEKRKIKSVALYVHVLIHGALVMILLWDIYLWYIAVIIMASHLVIDLIKLYGTNKKNKRWLFLMDQVAHVAVIVLIALIKGYDADFTYFSFHIPAQTWFFIACILFLTTPISIALKMFFTRWKLNPENAGIDSLKNAGNWIGIIERLLVFVFIVVGQFGAVGFLLAAKSVFRFGDLNREHNMKLTEYVLIGTLLSFGIAILTGIAFQQMTGL
ncbi:DUF3307 domain-containing protein [Nonlabens agnitus]|uniref:DUF3307 domain-containing protein n=1 Tax=Nonlabens agnitus TaxID=870484 RepID=A0A2S9WTG5_9FLAO|nr:DUF3307 domain-containing protein [Nonlabens agnitus]PRP66765.1 hypothetical protein BST86_06455 [Nonlabens agnitus]